MNRYEVFERPAVALPSQLMLTKNGSLCFVSAAPFDTRPTGSDLPAEAKGAFRQPFVTMDEISFYAFIIVIVLYPSL